MLGTMAIVSTVAAGYVGTASHGAVDVVGGVVVAFVFNLRCSSCAFKLLTAVGSRWRELLPGVDRRRRPLAAAAAPRRLLRRSRRSRNDRCPVRHLRARAGSAGVAVPRRAADDLRRRDQRRPRAPAVAAQLLLRPAARGRPPRADLLRARSRSASTRRTSRSASTAATRQPGAAPPAGTLPSGSPAASIAEIWLYEAVSGMIPKVLAHATTARYTN